MMKNKNKLQTDQLVKKINSLMIAIAAVFFLGSIFGYLRLNEYFDLKNYFVEGQQRLAEIQRNGNDAASAFNDLYKKLNSKNSEAIKALSQIFPKNEEYTALTREIDNYFLTANKPGSPIMLNSLTIGRPSYKSGSDYGELSVNISFTAKKKNFMDLLKHIQNSGDLNKGGRLMEVKSVNFSYSQGEATGDEAMVTGTIRAVSYIQNKQTEK